MDLTEAQNLFALFFAVYFALIIDRANEVYKPWDTYNAWRGRPHNIKRLMAGWIILFVIPLIHFAVIFTLLGAADIRFGLSAEGILNVVLVGLGSFFDFGYYRIYEALLHGYPGAFFAGEELEHRIPSGQILPDFRAHFIPGALYVILSTALVFVAMIL